MPRHEDIFESEGVASRTGSCTPAERPAGIHWIWGWVGPRASMVTMAKRKIPSVLLPVMNAGRPAHSSATHIYW